MVLFLQTYLVLLLIVASLWDLTACKQLKYVDAKGMAWEYEVRREQLEDGRTESYIVYNGHWTASMDKSTSSQSSWLDNMHMHHYILALAFCYML